ncbi:MAG: CRISPR-associated endoribonuclease Cas6 [Cyclobacteriaceae bacterium]
MRVRIVFNLNNRGSSLPFHHQLHIYKFIKSLTKIDSEIDINFSGLKGQTKVGRKGLHYCSNKVTLVVSCKEEQIIKEIAERLSEQNRITIGDLNLTLNRIDIEQIPNFQNKTKYLCISPIIINETQEILSPTSDEFSDCLYELIMDRMERSNFYSREQLNRFFNFQFVPDYSYINKMITNNKKISRKYAIDEVQDRVGYTLPFTLYAEPEVQDFVYTCGLGDYCHLGFGMIDVSTKETIQVTEFIPSGKKETA